MTRPPRLRPADTAAWALLHRDPVDDDTYRARVDVLGEARLVEVTALVGDDGLLADLLRVVAPAE